jgi:hypothetical protein
MHQSGRYGVKDIEDGRKKSVNRSDIHYSIDDVNDDDDGDGDGDGIHDDLLLNGGSGDGGKGDRQPIFRGASTTATNGLKKPANVGGSENRCVAGDNVVVKSV